MSRGFSAILFLFAGSTAYAQETCKPEYTVKYESCVTESSESKVQTVTSDWYLVNKGADDVSEALCTEKVAEFAAANPKATNVRYVSGENPKTIKTEDSTIRDLKAGWPLTKKDVYCRYTMDVVEKVPQEAEICGVQSVQSNNCISGLTVELARACVDAPMVTETDSWKRAACLLENYKNAPRIGEMDWPTFKDLGDHLKMIQESFAVSDSESERKLSEYVSQQLDK